MFEVFLGRRPSDQSGSALLIVAVIIGVVGVMSVLMFAYPDTEQKNEKELALEATFGRYVTAIQQQMIDPAFCTQHLSSNSPLPYPPRGVVGPLGPTPAGHWGVPITLYNMKIAGTSLTNISGNTRLGPSLPLIRYVDLRVAKNPYQTIHIDRGESFNVNGGNSIALNVFRARLYVVPDVRDRFSPHSWNVNDCTPSHNVPPADPSCQADGPPVTVGGTFPGAPTGLNFYPAVDPSKVVDLSLQIDTVTQKIYGCFGADSYAEYCDEQELAWDSQETDKRYRCQPDAQCIAIGGVVNAAGNCPPYPYIASPVGVVGSNMYICQWCNGNYRISPHHQQFGLYP